MLSPPLHPSPAMGDWKGVSSPMGQPEDAAHSPGVPAWPKPSSPAGLGFLWGRGPSGLRGGAGQCRGGRWLLCPALGHLILLQEELGGQRVSWLLGSHGEHQPQLLWCPRHLW